MIQSDVLLRGRRSYDATNTDNTHAIYRYSTLINTLLFRGSQGCCLARMCLRTFRFGECYLLDCDLTLGGNAMSRLSMFAFALLWVSSGAVFALPTASDRMCVIPTAKDTVHSLEQVPQSIAALLLKKYPGLKKTMADCPQYGPTDPKLFCLSVAAHYNDDWVIVVLTRGSTPVRGISVYRNSNELGARELMPQQAGIPRCSIDRIAGISPRTQSTKTPPKPNSQAPRNIPSPGRNG